MRKCPISAFGLTLATVVMIRGPVHGFVLPNSCFRPNLVRSDVSYLFLEPLKDSSVELTKEESLKELELASRRFRSTGVVLGIGMSTSAVALGLYLRILEAPIVGTLLGVSLIVFVGATVYHSEFSETPFSTNVRDVPWSFEVRPSNIPGAGSGLFVTNPKPSSSSNEIVIPKGSYLFDYQGERLSEDEYFERYPDGQGRYVAAIPTGLFQEPIYIDGMDPELSSWARWMNSQPLPLSNVVYKKQRFGPQAGQMYFYAARDICAGEELTFDYGRDYWDAYIE